jgi:hypothetical protein
VNNTTQIRGRARFGGNLLFDTIIFRIGTPVVPYFRDYPQLVTRNGFYFPTPFFLPKYRITCNTQKIDDQEWARTMPRLRRWGAPLLCFVTAYHRPHSPDHALFL